MKRKQEMHKCLVVNPHKKKICGKFKHRWKDNTTFGLKELEGTSVNCTKLDKYQIQW